MGSECSKILIWNSDYSIASYCKFVNDFRGYLRKEISVFFKRQKVCGKGQDQEEWHKKKNVNKLSTDGDSAG